MEAVADNHVEWKFNPKQSNVCVNKSPNYWYIRKTSLKKNQNVKIQLMKEKKGDFREFYMRNQKDVLIIN